MLEMDGPVGCCDRLSIDDVMDMTDALDEWDAAERRMHNRRPREDD